jgi:hypothetical protein
VSCEIKEALTALEATVLQVFTQVMGDGVLIMALGLVNVIFLYYRFQWRAVQWVALLPGSCINRL